MGAGAPQRPAAQAPEREDREQRVEMLEHRAHAARGLREELVQQAEVTREQLRVGEAPRRRRARRQHQRDDRAAGPGGHAEGCAQQDRDRVLAEFARDGGRLLDEARDRVRAAPQRMQGARAAQVVLEAARGEDARGFLPRGAQEFGGVRAEVLVQVAIVVAVHAHGVTPRRRQK